MERIQQKTLAILQQTTEIGRIPALKEAHLGRLGKTPEKSFSRIQPPPQLCNGELQSLWEHELVECAWHSEMPTYRNLKDWVLQSGQPKRLFVDDVIFVTW